MSCPKTKVDYCVLLDKVVNPSVCASVCNEGKNMSLLMFRKKRTLPSLSKRAVSFTASALKHTVTGMKERSNEDVARVQSICRTCEHYTELPGQPTCEDCGCGLTTKWKWKHTHCKLKKW